MVLAWLGCAVVGAVAVTPIFGRDAVGEAMQLRSTDVGADLEYQCNRALRRFPGVTLNDLLHGAEVPL